MRKDYYAILGVGRDATTEEIKRAFRRIARATHPDANPGDPRTDHKFREAAEAYEVLSDPERRRRYDRGDTIDVSDLFSGFGAFDDLLRPVFGEGGLFGSSRTFGVRGRDVLVRVEVDLVEAAFGTEREVEHRGHVLCEQCGGSGSAPGSKPATCPGCGGSGSMRVARRSLFGTMMSVTDCPTCRGEGTVVSEPCRLCGGSGSHAGRSSVKVEIPAGVDTGTRLRLSGRGEAVGRGGPPGDLYVEVLVRPDNRFERRNADLVHVLQLSMAEAALGCRVEVPLLEGGTTTLDIPRGTQPGSLFHLHGLGVPRLSGNGRGDLIVVVEVTIPDDLTPDEEELLRRFAEVRGERADKPATAG